MPWKDVIDCLQQGEGDQIEFLTGVSSAENLLLHIVSFLNHNGGKIVIGIDDKNDHLLGSNVSNNFITSAIEKISPSTSVSIEEISRLDKSVFMIKVPEGINKPYSYRNKYYIREGAENKKLSKDDMYPMIGPSKVQKLNNRQDKTLIYLKDNEKITNRIFRELFSVSHKTAHIELTDLMNRALILKDGQGRNTAYLLQK